MSMDNKNNDEVNIILEYKKIYDECDIEEKNQSVRQYPKVSNGYAKILSVIKPN
ncbi:hypothetical protein JP0077_11870 [Helicobacter pylori]|nr:hypothetical protein JP0077_11870 [Helicobacter pylori]